MKKPELSSCYLVVGDSFVVREAFKDIQTKIAGQVAGEMACQTFYLSDTPLEKILSEARMLPFLAAGQLFRVMESDRMKKGDIELLERYLSDPSTTTWLVLECSTIDQRHALPKLIAKTGEVVILAETAARTAAARFIQDKLRQFGKKIAPSARRILEEELGAMPSLLDSMLTQLILYCGEEAEITESMVESFRESFNEVDAFHITNAIADGQTGRALKLIRAMLEENERDALGLIGLLHWQMRRLWQARVLLEEGIPEKALLSRCKVFGKQTGFFMRQIRRLDRGRLENAIETLFKLDWKMKSGRAEGLAGIETWIVQSTARTV